MFKLNPKASPSDDYKIFIQRYLVHISAGVHSVLKILMIFSVFKLKVRAVDVKQAMTNFNEVLCNSATTNHKSIIYTS